MGDCMKCMWDIAKKYGMNECPAERECELASKLIEDMRMFGFEGKGINDNSYTFKLNLKTDDIVISKLLDDISLNEVGATVFFDKNSLEKLNLTKNYHLLNTINYFARRWLWNYPVSLRVLLGYYTKAESVIKVTSNVLNVSINFKYCGKKYFRNNCEFKTLFSLSISINLKEDDFGVDFNGVGGFSFTVSKAGGFNVYEIIDKLNELSYDGMVLSVDSRFSNTVKLLLSVVKSDCKKCFIAFDGEVLRVGYDGDEVVMTGLPKNFLSMSTFVGLVSNAVKKKDFSDICS